MDSFENILYVASTQPVGLAIFCHDSTAADKVKRQLYATRAKARERGESSYDDLSISFSPHSGDIVYVYKKKGLNGAG